MLFEILHLTSKQNAQYSVRSSVLQSQHKKLIDNIVQQLEKHETHEKPKLKSLFYWKNQNPSLMKNNLKAAKSRKIISRLWYFDIFFQITKKPTHVRKIALHRQVGLFFNSEWAVVQSILNGCKNFQPRTNLNQPTSGVKDSSIEKSIKLSKNNCAENVQNNWEIWAEQKMSFTGQNRKSCKKNSLRFILAKFNRKINFQRENSNWNSKSQA